VTDALRIPPIELAIESRADPASAWLALTEPDRVALWLTEVTPLGPVGAPYRLDFGDGSTVAGRVLLVEPGASFAHTWAWQDAEAGRETVVTWTIRPLATGGSRVTLRHEGWDESGDGPAARDEHESYWSGYLDDLRDVLDDA